MCALSVHHWQICAVQNCPEEKGKVNASSETSNADLGEIVETCLICNVVPIRTMYEPSVHTSTLD